MPKITEGQYALGALTVFAVWVFVVLPFLSLCSEPTDSNKEFAEPSFIVLKLVTKAGRDEITRYCTQHVDEQKGGWTQKYICDVKITDVYLAVFNILLVIVTGGLIIAGVLTIRQMKLTEERQLRAYILVESAELQNIDGPEPIRVIVTIKNFGRTPAYKAKIYNTLSLRQFPLTSPLPPLSLDEQRMPTATFGPSAILHQTREGPSLTNEQRTSIRNGLAAIFTSGRIEYFDAFKRKRFCSYCLVFGGHSEINVLMRDGKSVGIFNPYTEGNDAD